MFLLTMNVIHIQCFSETHGTNSGTYPMHKNNEESLRKQGTLDDSTLSSAHSFFILEGEEKAVNDEAELQQRTHLN
jgi:hypothetical protein